MTSFIKQNTKAIAFHRGTNLVLASLVLAAVFAYMYFAHTAVRAVTLLESTKTSVQNLSVKISEMEAKRFNLEGGLTVEDAKRLGFVEITRKTFIVSKPTKTARLDF